MKVSKDQTVDESKFIEILNQEMEISLGCTEPISITYATALARSFLEQGVITQVKINASRNLLKNAMSVTIPGTQPNEINGSSALMAAALGIIKPNPERNLEILNDINKIDVENAKELISDGIISLNLCDSKFKLYLEVIVETTHSKSKVVIANSHTNVVLVEVNDQILKEIPLVELYPTNEASGDLLNLKNILEFVALTDISKLDIIKKSIDTNKELCLEGLGKSYGLKVGKNIKLNTKNGFFSPDIISETIAFTAAGADARMSGCELPAMSNSGSGNQGISTTIPVVIFGEKLNLPSDEIIRAVTLSNLITIYIKSHLGRLSAMCGAIISATGASCGITYLLGGKGSEIESTIQIMLANLTGMICDGAKSGCALKISTCTYAAIQSALLAVNGTKINSNEGIIDKNPEKTIENLCNLANISMLNVDNQILQIMLEKSN